MSIISEKTRDYFNFNSEAAAAFERAKQNLDSTPNKVLGTTSSQNKFIGELKRHIDDYESGRGYRKSPVPKELNKRNNESVNFLAESQPEALSSYHGYSSGLTYSKKAYFVSGVQQAVTRATQLKKLYA